MPLQTGWKPRLGAVLLEGDEQQRCEFTVWAPEARSVDLHLIGEPDRYVSMAHGDKGYFHAVVNGITAGQQYLYRLNGEGEYPDPAARAMPDGVHGPSAVVERDFNWSEWSGLPIDDYIIYELHIGTFSPEGTYLGAIPHLDHLVELGVTAVELMPVNQFAGTRGWSYDGVLLFAPHNTYGTPHDFKSLIDACHQRGLAVILDVVYNHFGPVGNTMHNFGPYMTDKYRTPWGAGMNFDDMYSDEVRAYFSENALYWIHEFHLDALRLDATHFMYDFSAVTFIEDLIEQVGHYCQSSGRQIYLIAESDQNLADLVMPLEQGGFGMDVQWNDDFHHALFGNVVGAESSYHEDFGTLPQMVKAYREGFVNTGNYVPSRKRKHGSSSAHVPGNRFIIFFDDHDQIGNHMPADRLIKSLSFEQYKLMLGAVLLAPYIPMLWMGDEYAETAPFEFFVDFDDDDLKQAVREGRKAAFAHLIRTDVEIPDPTSEKVFLESKLNLDLKHTGKHRVMFEFHKHMIGLRRSLPALRVPDKDRTEVIDFEHKLLIYLRRWSADANSEVAALLNLGADPCAARMPLPEGRWRTLIASADARWAETSDLSQPAAEDLLESTGEVEITLPGFSFVVYARAEER
ncbi:MAG: malto-oligosyltrehalose trehalohydrolase [Chloroflexi bacterium]|uniref:malto-oligosyltrehalose trehalohydrolase n=1 Tax=Candidatus Flexifilum breve TaxID=3140694 RepID=UPI003136D7F6|nr:malto-oligosyltrehalose trehalohydrolase [Chloroflexota bacterium]